jgi:hypothetical protein
VSDLPEQPTTKDPDPIARTVIHTRHTRKVIPVSEEQFRP